MNHSFHVAFGIDNNYARPAGVTITSILVNNPTQDFVFHVLAHNISEENASHFAEIEKRFKTVVKIHKVDTSIFQDFGDFPKFRHYSVATFNKLLIPSTLHELTSRVLYLDADILCFGDIKQLVETDISNCIAAVVSDTTKTSRRQSRALSLKHEKYFNAGFMYINIGKWMEHDITNRVFRALFDKDVDLAFYDQDALNIALDGETLYLENKWDYQYRLTTQLRAGKTEFVLPEGTVFVHFVGAMKPWRDWSPHKTKAVFDRFQEASSWSNKKFNEKMHYKEIHSLAAFHVKNRNYIRGAKCYLSYIRNKLL